MTTEITTPSVDQSVARKRKKGFTLTEIAIVLGIVGLILGAVWAAAKSVYSNVNSTKTTELTSILIAQVRGAYGNAAPIAGDLSGAFGQVVFPNTIGTGTGAGTADVAGAQAGAASATPVNGFTIAFTGGANANHGAAFKNDAAGLASCNGVVQAVASLGGTSAAGTAALAIQLASPVSCTAAGACPPVNNETGSACSGTGGANGTGYCTYTLNVGGNAACAVGAAAAPVAVFVPYQPS